MTWGSGREQISYQEAKDLGLDHDIRPGSYISASPSRKSVIIDNGHPIGFIKRKDGWYVIHYYPYMAGNFQRGDTKDAIPYEQWKGTP